jgi:hypothetical protein
MNWDRPFGVWGYTTSHSVLLLRSLIPDLSPSRIDVAFVNVHAMQLRRFYDRLVLEQVPDFGDLIPSEDYLNTRASMRYYTINSGPDFVLAGNVSFKQDDGLNHDPSPFGVISTGF